MEPKTETPEKSENIEAMSGSKSFAEHMEGMEEQELQSVGLSGLGAQLSNTQILESEMMGNGPKMGGDSNVDEEDIEIDMCDDIDTADEPEIPERRKYPDGNQGPKGKYSDGTQSPSKSKFPDRSQSPKKGMYPDLNQSQSQSQNSKPTGPPLPPKHGKSMTTDSNLRNAFRSQKSIKDMTLEELEAAQAYEQERAIRLSLKSQRRPGSPSLSVDEFESADEGPDSTLKERLVASKTEADILRARVFQLEGELKETQDFVFSMQPRAQKLSEAEALADFNSLCGSVTEWVESKLGDSIEAMTQGNGRLTLGQPARIFLSMVPPAGREAFRYRDTDEHNIIALIMRCLCDWVLDREFYCNIEKGGMDFLHSIEKAMRNLEPRRDHITCRTWRSETYTAITNRHSFQTFRHKLREHVVYDLVNILHIFAPRMDQEKMGLSLLKSIVDPCLDLAHKLHLSVDKYSIRWTPYHTANWEQRQTMTLDLSQFECVDLISGRTIKFPPRGKLLTYLFDLSPGLVLETAQAQFFGEPKILKKPKILVAATKEEDGFYDPPLPRHGDPITLLGHMEEKIQSTNSRRFVFG